MKEQMIELMTEQARLAGVSLPVALATRLLEETERSLNDDNRRAAVRRLSDQISSAQQSADGGNDSATH